MRPRSVDDFEQYILIPELEQVDGIVSIEPGMAGGWAVEFDDGWIFGLRVDLVQRGEEAE